ncbi:MAG: radical SAM protein [Elusimicrobia bacterium]|nr:radical SAM protein [Elusimicrobiota bacterium]
MRTKARTLAIGFFPRKFCGEAAQFELGLHRIPLLVEGWEVAWVQLDHDDQQANVRALRQAAPDLVLLHSNRAQIVETVDLIDALTEELPELPLFLCGWVAHPPYVTAAFAAAKGLRHPNFALLCGEIEAIVPALLDRLASGGASLAGLPGVVPWDPRSRRWRGRSDFVLVEDVGSLPPVTIDHIPKQHRQSQAGWVDLSRGCLYRCAFCFLCCYRRPRMRRLSKQSVREGIRAAAEKGVKVLGLYTASVSLDIELMATVVDTFRELRLDDVSVVGAVGPIGRRFLGRDQLELLARLKWSVMTVGLQSITPQAIRLGRRPDDPETVARTMEFISTFATPEVELILGLPGDTPEGFRRTIAFVLSLPVNITVQTFRLDAWSSFFIERKKFGLKADFRDVGRVYESDSFPKGAIEDCRQWLRRLGRARWPYRAKSLALDGEQINDTRAAAGPAEGG